MDRPWYLCDVIGWVVSVVTTVKVDRTFWLKAGICKHLQWNLRITDTMGTGLLSFVERLSLSRRLALSKLAHSPRYVSIASSPGFLVWVGPSSCKARRALLCWNGKHSTAMAIMCINVWAIVGLSVLRGYFIYNCNHSLVSECPLYRVERLSVSRRLEIR